MKKIIITALILNLLGANGFAEEACQEGFTFDNGLNRCILSQKVVDSKLEAKACEGLTGEAAKACFDDNVKNEVSQLEADGEIKAQSNPKQALLIPAAITLGTAYFLFKRKEAFSKCGSMSVYLMLGGGVTTLLGEILTQRSYKKKLKKLASNYKNDVQETDDAKDATEIDITNQNQKKAFDFQIEQEHARADAHGGRKKTYNLAFALYSAATIAAIYEGFTNGWTVSQCSAEEDPETSLNFTPINQIDTSLIARSAAPEIFDDYYFISNLTYAEMIETVTRKLLSELSINAYAEEGGIQPSTVSPVVATQIGGAGETVAGATGDALTTPTDSAMTAGEQASGEINGLDKIAGSPAFRAAISGVLALHSRSTAKKAGKLQKEANERAEFIAKVRDDFLATGGSGFNYCTAEERKKPSKPICYCYTEDGQRNKSRLNSATCKIQFGANPNAIFAATDYSGTGKKGTASKNDCLNKNGTVNEGCDCRIGQCSTLKGNLNLGPIGDIAEANSAVDSASRLSTGDISPAELDDGSALRAAFKLQGNLDKLRKNQKTAKDIAKIDKARGNLGKSLALSVSRGLKSGAINPSAFGALGSAATSTSDKALSPSDLLKKTTKDIDSINNGGKLQTSSPKRKNTLADYDFGSENRGGIVIDESVKDGVMNKNYDLNDINENESVSIFRIINNRYQLTGLKRLFADEEKDIEKKADDNQTN